MTTRAAASASHGAMYVHDQIAWEQFEQKFREAFDREMTTDEHRWFHTIWTVINRREQEKRSGAAA